MTRIVLGIDLGTTISVVATVRDDGRVAVLENDSGRSLTPSVVHFKGPGAVVVGEDAKSMIPLRPDRVIAAIKRQMGTDADLVFDGVTYRPEGVSALILRSLVESAARALGTDPAELAAVVTVPAYFGTAEREATAAAAQIAGLELLDLVAEPVAAALSYGTAGDDSGTVVVYDLGGGTFDATVVELTEDGPRVVAVDGAARLGGVDFDERLGVLLVERYVLATDDDDAVDDEEFVLRLYATAEDVKKRLSRVESVSVPVERAESGRRADVAVSRLDFQRVTERLVDETLDVVERVIATAVSRGANPAHQVLLTGGSSRMPAIGAALGERLGLRVRLSDPDTAVAKGAALHARALRTQRSETPTDRLAVGSSPALLAAPVRTVLPRALGVKIMDSEDPTGERVIVRHVIPANTPLPVRAKKTTFATIVDGQDRIRVELMEQAGARAAPDLEFNRRVVDGELVGLTPNLPAGSAIDLAISIDSAGRVSFTAAERTSGRQLELVSYMDGVVDAAELEDQRRAVAHMMVRS